MLLITSDGLHPTHPQVSTRPPIRLRYFTMLMTDLTRHRVRVAPDLWSIMTAFALIEGSISELGFGVNVLGA